MSARHVWISMALIAIAGCQRDEAESEQAATSPLAIGKPAPSPTPPAAPPAAPPPPMPTPAGTRSLVLDDIPLPDESGMGGKIINVKPWRAKLDIPVTATVIMLDHSNKYDQDGEAYPQIADTGWTINIARSVKTLEAHIKSYTSTGFSILRGDQTPDGHVLVVGSKSGPLELIVFRKSMRLACHAFVHGSAAALEATLTVCQSLAPTH